MSFEPSARSSRTSRSSTNSPLGRVRARPGSKPGRVGRSPGDQVRADDEADRVEGRVDRGGRVLVGDGDQQVVDRDRRGAARARVGAPERGPGRVDDGQLRGVLDLGPQVLGTLHGPADDPPSGVGIDSYRHRVLAKRAARLPFARPRARHPVVPASASGRTGETRVSRPGRGSSPGSADGAGTAGGVAARRQREAQQRLGDRARIGPALVREHGDRDALRRQPADDRAEPEQPARVAERPAAGDVDRLDAQAVRERRLARAGRGHVDEHPDAGHRREHAAAVERLRPVHEVLGRRRHRAGGARRR